MILFKKGPSWIRFSVMLSFGLILAAISKHRWLFWGIIAANAVAGLIGLLGYFLTGKVRRMIIRNMTPHEKAELSGICQRTGKKLGIRVAPMAFLVPFLCVLFGINGFIYMVPFLIVLLVILCFPVWQTVRTQTNGLLLSTVFAQTNGIETLGEGRRGQVFTFHKPDDDRSE